ncbi:MAG: hypothetical protein COA65_02040 [Rhodospirillaceae bacterium]|nr:MAG: hypothetical protein COA65_02040 [Rhodospirillaceae bacterium]
MLRIGPSCLKGIFQALNFIVPKRANQVCIHSFPDYDDMTRGLLDGLSKSAVAFQIVILTHTLVKTPKWIKENRAHVRQYRKLSARGIWAYLRSKYVFFTHGCFASIRPVQKQITVNVWHGMPIKKIGCYLEKNQRMPFSTYTISTSPFFSKVLSTAFATPEERILEVGLPRNDILLKAQNRDLKKKICGDQKLAIWLPTYRKVALGEKRLDGRQAENIFNLPDLDIDALDGAFKDLGLIVLVKPHPMAARLEADFNPESLSNIRMIDEEWLGQSETTLYELLSMSDMLITDISSVLVDYLLLDRPILCHFPDMAAYKKSRGLIWDFDPTEHGIPLVVRQKELVEAVKKYLDRIGEKNLYPSLLKLLHADHKNSCCELIRALDMEN